MAVARLACNLYVAVSMQQAQLIDRIVDSARSLQRVLPAEPQLVSLDAVIEDAVALARHALGSAAPPIQTRHTSDPWSLEVDAARLQRAIANLIVNAAKHSGSSAPAIAVIAHASAAGVDVVVTRAGGGIAPAALAGGNRQTGCTSPGLDLQMALARQLVETQGGSLLLRAADNAPQPSLVIRLPARNAKRSAVAKRFDRRAHNRLDGVQLLLVEDDPDALEFLSLILRQTGATVMAFSHPAPAFEYYCDAATPPDLIVSDIAMPGEDGYSFLWRLRAWESSHGRVPVPAIAVSAFGRAEDVQRARAHGFDAHLSKPLDASQLIELIAAWARPGA